MAWTIEYEDIAEKQLRKLDRNTAKRIVDFLDHRLAHQPEPRTLGQPLHGRLRQYWRYRVGDFRVVCDIVDERLVVLVVQIGHRSDIYR